MFEKQPFSKHGHSKYPYSEDSVSTYINNKGALNIENKSIIEILKQLQGKGLINQHCRPIDTAIISKAPHSTHSQSLISPIAENNVNDISDNDIINQSIPSINRSLPVTPMPG